MTKMQIFEYIHNYLNMIDALFYDYLHIDDDHIDIDTVILIQDADLIDQIYDLFANNKINEQENKTIPKIIEYITANKQTIINQLNELFKKKFQKHKVLKQYDNIFWKNISLDTVINEPIAHQVIAHNYDRWSNTFSVPVSNTFILSEYLSTHYNDYIQYITQKYEELEQSYVISILNILYNQKQNNMYNYTNKYLKYSQKYNNITL